MPLVTPKTEPGYPPNCITVDDAVQSIKAVFKSDGLRVLNLRVECVTKDGNVLKYSWDKRDVK